MRSGIWVLNIFAAIWGVAAILVGHLPGWLVVVPAAVSGALLVWATRHVAGVGAPGRGAHAGRVIGVATAIEGLALFLVANLLVQNHLPTAVMPAAAIIVGLHFLPIARWVPVPLYYRTAAALVVVGVGALLLPPPARAIPTGVGAALVLWASGIALTRHGRG